MDTLSSYGIESVMVQKDLTHLLQPLDLITSASFKKYEKRASVNILRLVLWKLYQMILIEMSQTSKLTFAFEL